MKISLSAQTTSTHLVNFQGTNSNNTLNLEPFFRRKDKVVFVMGATGTGKSRLAIDLATRFPAEIVNSDKIQVYKGLDIVTNKVTEKECRGVPHHLLSIVADSNSNFTATDFRHHASSAINSIVERDRLPIVAGGSNSYIEALVDGDDDDAEFRYRYECCFIWVDVALPVLHSYVSERVDRMFESGLLDEVRNLFDPRADYSRGIRRAIGVPELDEFLRVEFENNTAADDKTRARILEAAIAKIKENTSKLAFRQLQKIHRLRNKWGWKLHRVDATEVFSKRGGEYADEAWELLVVEPSSIIMEKFLYKDSHSHRHSHSHPITTTAIPKAAVAAATR